MSLQGIRLDTLIVAQRITRLLSLVPHAGLLFRRVLAQRLTYQSGHFPTLG